MSIKTVQWDPDKDEGEDDPLSSLFPFFRSGRSVVFPLILWDPDLMIQGQKTSLREWEECF